MILVIIIIVIVIILTLVITRVIPIVLLIILVVEIPVISIFVVLPSLSRHVHVELELFQIQRIKQVELVIAHVHKLVLSRHPAGALILPAVKRIANDVLGVVVSSAPASPASPPPYMFS